MYYNSKHFVETVDDLFNATMSSNNTMVKETDNGYQVVIEMPGAERDSINIKLVDDIIKVKWTRDKRQKETNIRVNSKFNQDIKANYDNGLLTLTLKQKDERIKEILLE